MYPHLLNELNTHNHSLNHISFIQECGGAISQSTFFNNSATCITDAPGVCSALGGALCVTLGSTWAVDNCTFDQNTLSGQDGSILKGATIMMLQSLVSISGSSVNNSRALTTEMQMDGTIYILKVFNSESCIPSHYPMV